MRFFLHGYRDHQQEEAQQANPYPRAFCCPRGVADQERQENKWVLVDAGLKTTGSKIEKLAEQLFWPDTTPAAIILTHGHFDHVGSLRKLADKWDVPIYAHELEKPYLTGQSSYPPPDPLVGGGMMSYISFLYPKGPIDVSDRLMILPKDGNIPVLKGWRYVHTPGHAPGHISLFRESDKLLIAGDAFVTTKNESAICAITQPKIMSGPPKYFTYNWQAAERSVKLLASLEPEIVATGHGQPMSGEGMRDLLHELAENFRKQAVPLPAGMSIFLHWLMRMAFNPFHRLPKRP